MIKVHNCKFKAVLSPHWRVVSLISLYVIKQQISRSWMSKVCFFTWFSLLSKFSLSLNALSNEPQCTDLGYITGTNYFLWRYDQTKFILQNFLRMSKTENVEVVKNWRMLISSDALEVCSDFMWSWMPLVHEGTCNEDRCSLLDYGQLQVFAPQT